MTSSYSSVRLGRPPRPDKLIDPCYAVMRTNLAHAGRPDRRVQQQAERLPPGGDY